MCVMGFSFGQGGAVWWMFVGYCCELIPLARGPPRLRGGGRRQ
jgi:hypothetical protein